jgi:uncharacterized membrane protein
VRPAVRPTATEYPASMTAQETARGRERDLDRLLTFVDAVVAIAITLLVLPLVELTTDLTENESVANLLHKHQPELWSFLLSFVVIARLWFAQHQAVRPLVVSHDHVSTLLVLWMLTIAFLPFPTALVAKAGHQPATKVLYIGTIALSTVATGLVSWVMRRNPQITDGQGKPDAEPGVVSGILLLLALVITLSIPATSYFPLLLLFLEPPVRQLMRMVRRRSRT